MTHLEMFEVALEAVRDGCAVARAVQAEAARPTLEKSDKSPVTVADFGVQAVVARHLAGAFSSLVLVGEESAADASSDDAVLARTVDAVRTVWAGASADAVLEAIDRGAGEPTSDAFWTLDPIDGTKGFLRGQQYCISLSYIEGGKPVLGVLGCPNLPADPSKPFDPPDESGSMYFAIEAEGAFELVGDRRRPIRASVPAADAITFCESVEAAHSDQDANRRLVESLGVAEVRSVRIDSQCKYAVVARGQADAYLRLPKSETYVEKIWDHAAGSIVATEAGCTVSDVRGEPLDFSRGRRLENNRGVVVATASLHNKLIRALTS